MKSSKTKLFTTATGISFLGTLPLGTLNISVAHLMFQHNTQGAISFALAATAVEMLAVRLALILVKQLQAFRNYYWLFRLLSVAVLLTMAILIFISAAKPGQDGAAIPLIGSSPFIAGLTLSALNPLHIPFWMGWTAVLKSRGILNDESNLNNLFVAAIGLGTLLAFLLYGMMGGFLIQVMGHWQCLLNWLLGLVLLLTAMFQLYKMVAILRKKKNQQTAAT